MDHDLFKKLNVEGLISDLSFSRIEHKNAKPLFSLHWELKTLLYLGILLLTTGLGIIVYKNIDTIGHQAILAFIAAICIGCFVYCFKHKKPFSTERIQVPGILFDYLLLLGALSFLIFIGYLQFQYEVFGTNYGMATFIPMLVLFYLAYSFDHLGILSLAITNLGIWLGVTVTPKKLLAQQTFNDQTIIYTYLGFGLLLLVGAWLTEKYNFKKHFKFSYQHFGVHVSLIALLAGYFHNYDSRYYIFWLLALFALAYILYLDAYKDRSFYFILLVILYSYIGISSLLLRALFAMGDIFLTLSYFVGSAIGLVYLLIYLNKKLKAA